MQPVGFAESNMILDKPADMDRDDCEPIQVMEGHVSSGHKVIVSCWKVTKEELEEIQKTGRIWLVVYGTVMPPVAISGKCILE